LRDCLSIDNRVEYRLILVDNIQYWDSRYDIGLDWW